jgi:hypothetical protein
VMKQTRPAFVDALNIRGREDIFRWWVRVRGGFWLEQVQRKFQGKE